MIQTNYLSQVLEAVTFVSVQIVCWTGSSRLQPSDLGLTARDLPPQELARLGVKRLVDPVQVRRFSSIRGAVRRRLLAVGTRFMGGFIVPDDRVQEVLDAIEENERKEFTALRQQLLDRLDQIKQEWAQANPQWAAMIRNAPLDHHYVAERLGFAVQAVKLGAAPVSHSGLEEAASSLADNLYKEIGQMAKEALEESFIGKQEVTRRALRPLAAIQHKMAGLWFLDRRVRPVAAHIQTALAGLPRKGAIKGVDLQALMGLLQMLENPRRLKQHGDQLLKDADGSGTVFTPMPLNWQLGDVADGDSEIVPETPQTQPLLEEVLHESAAAIEPAASATGSAAEIHQRPVQGAWFF